MRRSWIGMLVLLTGLAACSQEQRTTAPPSGNPSPSRVPDAPRVEPAAKPTPPPTATAPAPETKPAEKPPQEPADAAVPAAKQPEPDFIRVQHCLIAFKGSLPKPSVTRSQEEAKKLAYDILERARKGEDFAMIVQTYTDDAAPGIYAMTNLGKPPRPNAYPRDRMVPAFGDTGFPLQVGEYGIADFDAKKSPYGWHIVKRIE